MENIPDWFLAIIIVITFISGFTLAFILQLFNDRSYRIGIMDGSREIMYKQVTRNCNCE